MKKLAAYFLILLPGLAFAQLFPKVPGFTGNLRQITEKRYGREVPGLKKTDGKYHANAFSGWTLTYRFDKNSRLISRTEVNNGKIESKKQFTYKVDGPLKIIRQTETGIASKENGSFLETQQLLNSGGQISEVDYLSYDAKTGATSLYLVENKASYSNGKLMSFRRIQFDDRGDTTSVEACTLSYDEAGRLAAINRSDVNSGLNTMIHLHYNSRGRIDRYSVDLLAELRGIGNNQVQNIFYKYDRHGNWKRMYRGAGRKKQLEAKRKNIYW
jgi:YD repeat-containing protein